MSRSSVQSLRGGGTGQSELTSNVSAQVVARPVDTTVNPAESKFTRLSNAIQGFLPGYGQHVAQETQRWEEEERMRGAKDAQMSEVSTADSAISAYSTDASPIAQIAFRKAMGNRIAKDANEGFSQHVEENFEKDNPDPEYAKNFARDYFNKHVSGMDDPLFLGNYSETTAQIVNKFSNEHVGMIVQKHREQKIANVTSSIQTDLENPNRPANWIETLKESHPYLEKSEVEGMAWTTSLEYAINTGDPYLLDSFLQPTADGQKGFVYRGGAETLKQYYDARQRAMKNFLGGTKANMDIYQNELMTSLDRELIDIGNFELEITDQLMAERLETTRSAINAGIFTGEKASSYNERYYKAHQDWKKLSPVAERVAAGDGTYDLASLSPEDQQRVLKLAARNTPGTDPRLLAVRSGVMLEEDQRLMANVANYVGNAETGELPPNLEQGFQVMQHYLHADGGSKSEVFWGNLNKANPEAFHFWANMDMLMRHSPDKDLPTLSHAAKTLTSNRNNQVKYEGQSANDTLNSVTRKIAKNNTSWYNFLTATGEQTNPYVRTWVIQEMNNLRALHPNATEGSLETTVAKRFNETHALIGKSWVDVSTLPAGMGKDQASSINTALQDFRAYAMLHYAGDTRLGWSMDELDDYEVSLRPVPKVFNANGEPLFHISINNTLLPEPVNLLQLQRQSQNREFLSKEAIATVESVLAKLDEGYANPQDYSPLQLDHDMERLEAGRRIGLISDAEFQKYSTIAENHRKVALGEELGAEVKDREALIKASPLRSSMANTPDPEILTRAAPPPDLMDPKMGNVSGYVVEQARGQNPQLALGAAVYGRSGMIYEQEGEKRLGFGYTMPEDYASREHIAAMKYVLGSGNIQFATVSRAVREGRARLTNEQAERLFKYQLKGAQDQIIGVIGAPEFSAATPGMQYGLSTLVTTLGNPEDASKVLEMVTAGDFAGIPALMTRVPESNRASALAYIRSMMQGTAHFRALVDQRLTNQRMIPTD